LPKELKKLMKEYPKTVIAGGYIRSIVTGEPVSDIDVFTHSKEKANHMAEHLASEMGFASKKIIKTDNAFTIPCSPYPVQFVHRWVFDSPMDVVRSFDYTISTGSFWWAGNSAEDSVGNKWASYVSEKFYPDLASRRLIYTSPVRNEDAGGSLLRMLKYYQRGYRITLPSLGAVIARLMQGVENFSSFHLTEEMLAKVLTGLLREVDPLIDPDHIAHEANPDKTIDEQIEEMDE